MLAFVQVRMVWVYQKFGDAQSGYTNGEHDDKLLDVKVCYQEFQSQNVVCI